MNGQPIKLTSHEYRLLSYLMHHAGRIISRTEIVEHLYEQDFDRDSNTIEVFIGRLRKKLGVDIIKTARGLGYIVGADETTATPAGRLDGRGSISSSALRRSRQSPSGRRRPRRGPPRRRPPSPSRRAPRVPTRALEPQRRDERRLVPVGVLARALAERGRVAFGVEQVVGDLERGADRRAIGEKRSEADAARAGERAPASTLNRNSAPVFIACRRAIASVESGDAALGGDVEHLAAHHAGEAAARARPAQSAARISAFASVSGSARISKASVCSASREDRGRLVEGAMGGRPAAPQIVVVHRRQIVVDQRIGVQHSIPAARGPAAVAASERARRLDDQEGPQPLPPPSVE